MRKELPLVLILLVWVLAAPTIAQDDGSIKQKILNQQPSDLEMISKGRSLTLEYLMSGNLIALKEVKDYLAGEKYNPYDVFTPLEYWLLSFWTEDFVELLHEATAYAVPIDTPGSEYYRRLPERFRGTPLLRMITESDRLTEELGRKSAEAYIPLTVSIDNAELNGEEKEFLKLWLYALLFMPEKVDEEVEMEEINDKAAAFLDRYPESDYSDYTRQYIRYRFRPGNWGVGYDFFLGYRAFTGGLSDYFDNRIAGGFAMDVLYKEFTASLRINISSTKTFQAFTHQGITWPQGVKGSMVIGDVALLYPVYQNRGMKLSPFVGIGGMGMGPNETAIKERPELEEFKELSSFYYLAGLDLKLNTWNKEVDLSRYGGGYVGLRYTYYFPNYHNRYELLNGNMHMLTVSFGMFARPVKRDF